MARNDEYTDPTRTVYRIEPEGTLVHATDEELDYVVAHYREQDRREAEIVPDDALDRKAFDEVFTIRIGQDIVGYFGLMVPMDANYFCDMRYMVFMSSEGADKHKLAFVKGSRNVMKFVVARTPRWVKRFMSIPLASYEMSVKWQKRVLGLVEIGRMTVPGCPNEQYVQLFATRKDILT